MIYKWLKSAQYLIYPPTCLLCGGQGQQGRDICEGCLRELPRNLSCCLVCALPLPQEYGTAATCGNCLMHHPGFDLSHAPFLYLPPIGRLIGDLKFNSGLTQARLLARLVGDSLETAMESPPELLIPVPLHPSRLRERGYNQSLELARPLSRQFGIPLQYNLCTRIRATPHQLSLKKQDRARNVKGGFRVSGKLNARHVALIDDVITTGATVSELARLLKKNGVERVDVWAVARTP